MHRGGRGNKRRYDDYGRNARPNWSNRPTWEEEFDYEVRQLKQNAIHQHGNEQGIPVLSFRFIGERQIRHAHQSLNSAGGGDLRDRIAPRHLNTAADDSDRVAKRQKKGKETAADPANKQSPAPSDNKGPKKEDKANILKGFDDELDNYFSDNKDKEVKEATKENKPEVVEKSEKKDAAKPKGETAGNGTEDA